MAKSQGHACLGEYSRRCESKEQQIPPKLEHGAVTAYFIECPRKESNL